MNEKKHCGNLFTRKWKCSGKSQSCVNIVLRCLVKQNFLLTCRWKLENRSYLLNDKNEFKPKLNSEANKKFSIIDTARKNNFTP